MKKIIILSFLLVLLCCCRGNRVYQFNVSEDTKFGGILLHVSPEDFNKLGFSFGDSINVELSNGFVMTEILACGYPGYTNVVINKNNYDFFWKETGANETTTAKITLNTKGKYLAVQNALNLRYSNERNDFASDEVFANFRALKGGKLRNDILYRSASPCDNEYNRAAFVDTLATRHNVSFIINLSDSTAEVEKYMSQSDFNSPHFKKLYETGNVALLDLSANYSSKHFTKEVSSALYDYAKQNGIGLIHCVEGKDRTGFVCMLVLALADASESEIIADYMVTYDNYYGLTEQSDKAKYDAIIAIKAMDYINYLKGLSDSGDLSNGAKKYLSLGGLNEEQTESIVCQLKGE